MATLQRYFTSVEHSLRIDPKKRAEVVSELQSHVLERSDELQKMGVPAEEAADHAIRDLGDPHALANSLYAVHATSSVRDTILAMLPHLALAFMFGFHLWIDAFWVAVAVVVASLIAVLCWRRGLSEWAYPWLGYAIVVPAITGTLAAALVGYGVWQAVSGGTIPLSLSLYSVIALWVPFSAAIVAKVVRRAVRHDWLVVSLAALPLPFFAVWAFLLHFRGGALIPNEVRALETDSTTSVVFVALAATTALYMKIGHRRMRLLIMLLPTSVLAAVASTTYHETPEVLLALVTGALTCGFLVLPMFFDHHIRDVDRSHGVSGSER